MGLGVIIPDSCMECEILPTCKIVPRWMTKETQDELKNCRMKRCPYNLFVGRNDEDDERREPKGFTADEWYRDTFGENDGK